MPFLVLKKYFNFFSYIKKILIIGLLLTSVTGSGPLVQKVYASDAPDYVFKVENPAIQHAYFDIFNAIKVLFASPGQSDANTNNSAWKSYTGLLKLVFVLSGFFIFAAGVVKIFGGGEAAAKSAVADFIKYILIGFVLIFMLYSWKASVEIDGYQADTFCDNSSDSAHYVDVIDNFPGVLAFTYTFINNVGLTTSELVQELYAPDSEFITTKNYGYMGALKANMHLLGIDINDIPYYQDDNSSDTAKADLGNRYGALIAQCILTPFSACANGMSYINEMKQTNNIYGFLKDLYTNDPVICNNIHASDYELNYAGKTIKCGDFWNNINTLTTQWKDVLACSLPNVTKGGIALFDSNLSTPTVSDLQQIALQVGLVSQMQKTYANLGLGVNGLGYAAGKSKAEFIQTSLASGAYMAEMLPVLQMVIRALLYAFFPFVFVVILLPGGLSVLKQYLQSILWIELWTPTAGILNMFMLDYAQKRLEQQYDISGINSYNLTYYLSNDSMIAGVAGYLYLSVPALTWLILKGSGYMLGNIAGAVGANISRNIQTQAINQDTSELKKYQEFAERTPGYVSLAEMSHYEALQKGAVTGGALAGTESIDLETQATGSYYSSYVATAKNAGQAIQTFESITKHSNKSVSDASFVAGKLEGAKTGTNMAEKADTVSIGQEELLGMDSAVIEKNTAIGKETSGAYTLTDKGKSVRKGDKKHELGEFKKYEEGIAEKNDLSMNDIMAFGFKREKLEAEGIRDATHKARQIEEGLLAYLQAKGQLKMLHEGIEKGIFKVSVSKGGTIDNVDITNAKGLKDAIVTGNAINSLDKIIGPAAAGQIANKFDKGSSVEYVKNQLANKMANDTISQGSGEKLRQRFGDMFDKKFQKNDLIKKPINMEKGKPIENLEKKLHDKKKIQKIIDTNTSRMEADKGNYSEETASVGVNALTSLTLNGLIPNRGLVSVMINRGLHHNLGQIQRDLGRLFNKKVHNQRDVRNLAADIGSLYSIATGITGADPEEQKKAKKLFDKYTKKLQQDKKLFAAVNSVFQGTDEAEGEGTSAIAKKTKKDVKTFKQSQPEQPSTVENKNENQPVTTNKKELSFDKNDKIGASVLFDQGKANADSMIGKAIGVHNNLTKDANMYLRNSMAQEMATQQSMAEKINTQGGVNNFVGTQVASAMLQAAAQKGETEGRIKQLAKAAGFSDKDAQKIIDSFKKGADELRKAGDDFANKIKEALNSIKDVATKQADFQGQQKQAVMNGEFNEAVKQGVYNQDKGTMSSLGEEAYTAQGSTKLDKTIGPYTKQAKQAEQKMWNKIFKKEAEQIRMSALKRGKIISEKEAMQEVIRANKAYIKGIDENGNIIFKTGKELKDAEALMDGRKFNLVNEEGITASVTAGQFDVGGGVSAGLSGTYNDSTTLDTGTHVRFNPGTTIADSFFGPAGAIVAHSLPFVSKTGRAVARTLFGKEGVKEIAEKYGLNHGLFGVKGKPGFLVREGEKLKNVGINLMKRGKNFVRSVKLAAALEGSPIDIKAAKDFISKSYFYKTAKMVGEDGLKFATEEGAEFLSKRIPGVGTAIEFADASMRWSHGDYLGAVISMIAGVATDIPGAGTAISMALDGVNMGKDFLFKKIF